jgi:anti-sigma B factor antagonist
MGSVDAPDADADSPDSSEPPEPPDFRVDAPEPGRLEVHGEVDAATAPALNAAIAAAAADSDAAEVILDLTGLDFIDSSGLSVLVSNHQRLSSQSRTLVILQPPPAARRLFEIAGLDQVLTIR